MKRAAVVAGEPPDKLLLTVRLVRAKAVVHMYHAERVYIETLAKRGEDMKQGSGVTAPAD